MPFTTKAVLPVLPKPDHIVGQFHSRQLSAIEDKELRKKLRNRQSALAARERKKARMLELERKVAELQLSNKVLEGENLKLRRTLNEIIRSAASSGVRCLAKPCTTVTRCYFAKSAEDANVLENCGAIDPPGSQNVSTTQAAVGETTNFIPGHLSNTIINYKVQGSRKNAKETAAVEYNQFHTCADNQNPIDYSMNSNRSNARKNLPVPSGVNRKSIKAEDEPRFNNTNQVTKRGNDVINTSSVEDFYRSPSLNSAIESITVKQEACDIVFVKNGENYRKDISNVPPANQSPSETDSPFAKALKRSADSMLSSAPFATARLGSENRILEAHPMKISCKRKQALPSIDAVFYSQPKAPNVTAADLTELTQHSPDRVGKYLEKSTCTAFGSNNAGEQPLSLVKSPPDTSRPKRDPYLHQHSESAAGNFVYNPTRSLSDVGDSSVILLPSELSTIIANYSNGSATESDDMLAAIYDDPGNSPLESVCSRDSGLGVEEDPLDWIPDASFFDF